MLSGNYNNCYSGIIKANYMQPVGPGPNTNTLTMLKNIH